MATNPMMSKFSVASEVAGIVLAVSVSTGCATLFRPVPVERVVIASEPANARAFVDNEEIGTTPLEVELSRRASEYVVRLEREGCAPSEIRLGRSRSKWRFVPIVAYPFLSVIATNDAGGPNGLTDWMIGLGVYTAAASLFDRWTGARYSLPDRLAVSLCGRGEVDQFLGGR